MAGGRSPVMRRRRLAAELQRLRLASGRTLEEVAAYLECSPAKVSRIENGQVAVRIQDARELLELYRVDGDRREDLLQMVRQARGRGWWSDHADVLEPGAETLLSLEDEAAGVFIYETNLVTALLQTPRYAFELFSSWTDVPLDRIRRQVEVTEERQRVLERANAPELSVVLDESCLHRVLGGAEVMREQYQRLVSVAGRPGVDLRILPFAAGPHQAMGFGFHIFQFTGDDPAIVHIERLYAADFLEGAEEVGRYQAAFHQARERALSPERSLALLEGLAAGVDAEPA
ncbi:transcriptional regulator with XRE-family HTH domain [Catenulispora sp. MAP12-49]|uniref:helix-turn-helix domain-containing protein n=1 Tax=Catenulispora sp. MAP12-49 TaxID=3156302 RepID=UPI003511CE2F